MNKFSVVLIGILLVFFTWVFGVRSLGVLLQQHATESYPSVQGKVWFSQVTTTTGSKGRVHYHVSIGYRYEVNGLEYSGRHYRYDGHPSDRAGANAIVAAHPENSLVAVYYNPQFPSDAVLSNTVDAEDVYELFIFAPIFLVIFVILMNGARRLDWTDTPEFGGIRIITENMVTRARLPRFQPYMAGLIAAAVVSLLVGICIAVGVLSPPWIAGEESLVAVLLGAAVFYGWQYRRVHSGRQDLVINELARTVQLPETYKRREQAPMPFSTVKSVAINRVRHQNKSSVYYTYMVALELTDGSSQKLIDLNQQRAESFAAWLSGKLGLSRLAGVTNPEP